MRCVALAASASIGTVLLGLLASTTPEQSRAEAVQAQAVLREIREVRQLTLVKPDREGGFVFSSDRPGLRLMLDLQVPQGRTLIDIDQPEKIEAVDSSGRDLTDIEPGFGGKREYIEVSQSFNFDKESYDHEVTMHLAVPSRAAESFSVSAVVQATTYAGLRDLSVDLKTAWTNLDPTDFGGLPARVRLKKSFGDDYGVELSPARAARFIESFDVGVEGNAISSSGSMSDDRTIVYFLDDSVDPNEPATMRIKLRQHVETTPVEIIFKDQRLP